jgi:hypothetical protein
VRRDDAEQMLNGAPAATETTRPLAALLNAATAPAHPDELAGERAALAAFENAAQLVTPSSPRRLNVLKSTLAKIVTVKAAVILAAAAGTTGVVLASTTGALNHGDGSVEHGPADRSPAVHSSAHAPAATHRNDNDDNDDNDNDRNAGGDSGKSGEVPNPSMLGLCNAYAAHKSDNPGKALDSPAFTALITAAGGKDKVDSYCYAVTADKDNGRSGGDHGKPIDHPGNPGNGNPDNSDPDKDNPGQGNDQHPTAPPNSHHGAPAPSVIGG